jgi:hypothetical protein
MWGIIQIGRKKGEKLKMKKIGLIALALVMMLGMLGIGYAA